MCLTQFSILVDDWGNGYKFEVQFVLWVTMQQRT